LKQKKKFPPTIYGLKACQPLRELRVVPNAWKGRRFSSLLNRDDDAEYDIAAMLSLKNVDAQNNTGSQCSSLERSSL